ncbi:MAG: cytochrome c biogenesis CcdA family protein [Candidatus Humimicrobiaceae bacterium]
MFEVGLASAFIAGILSFISPCILPLVPVYISFMTNKASVKNEKSKISDRLFIFLNSIFFVLGFSLIFIILGSTATFIGSVLRDYSNIISRVGGGLLILFGLNYMGLFKLPFLNFEKKFNIPESAKYNYLGSFLIGIIFSFGWVPCIGMILSGILLLASRLDTLAKGIYLLLAYSLGLGLPFILFSVFIGLFSKFFKRMSKYMRIVTIISGVFLIILGIVFLTGSMIKLVGFILKYLPFLGKLAI